MVFGFGMPVLGVLRKPLRPWQNPALNNMEKNCRVRAALIESVDSGRIAALNLRVTLARRGGINRTVGPIWGFGLGLMGDYSNCGMISRILVFRE